MDAYEPSDEDIRLRAYYLYLERQEAGLEGTAADDWILAEAELADQAERPDETRLRMPSPMPPTSLRTPRSARAEAT